MESPDSKDYANRPCGEGVVFYNQHLQAAEQAAQQRLPGTQSQQDAQDEQQAQPQPRLQPDLQPPASLLQQALPPPPQQQQRPPVPASGQTGAAAALLPGLSRAEEGDGEAGPSAAAGVIFGCTNSTYEECFRLSMVGLPRKYLPLVESIVAEHTLIFLFNFSDRQLHGVYIATSAGQENLSLSAWKGLAGVPKAGRKDEHAQPSGIELEEQAADPDGSPFPAQCSFDILEEFTPLPEPEFRHVLEYTERQRFKFKLSYWQCRDLIQTLCRYDAKLRARRICDQFLGYRTDTVSQSLRGP